MPVKYACRIIITFFRCSSFSVSYTFSFQTRTRVASLEGLSNPRSPFEHVDLYRDYTGVKSRVSDPGSDSDAGQGSLLDFDVSNQTSPIQVRLCCVLHREVRGCISATCQTWCYWVDKRTPLFTMGHIGYIVLTPFVSQLALNVRISFWNTRRHCQGKTLCSLVNIYKNSAIYRRVSDITRKRCVSEWPPTAEIIGLFLVETTGFCVFMCVNVLFHELNI